LHEDRDVFFQQLEHDRRLRRLAMMLIPALLSLDYEESLVAVEKARKLVRLVEGLEGPIKPVPATAAALYAKLPLDSPRDALRVLHIIETSLCFAETGSVDARLTKDILIILGSPMSQAKHLRLATPAPANDVDLVILPDFPQAAAPD
jgi:hypothetical protein